MAILLLTYQHYFVQSFVDSKGIKRLINKSTAPTTTITKIYYIYISIIETLGC